MFARWSRSYLFHMGRNLCNFSLETAYSTSYRQYPTKAQQLALPRAISTSSQRCGSDSPPTDHGEGGASNYQSFAGFIGFLDEANIDLTGRKLAPGQTDRIRAEAQSIVQLLARPDDPDPRRSNIDFTAHLVAPYRVLKADGQSVASIRSLLEATMERCTAQVTEAVRHQLDGASDPFSFVVNASREKEASFYLEPDFKHQRASDSVRSYHLEVHRCWYMDTLRKLGASEIGPVFCTFDKSWYRPIDVDRHGFKFTRPSTIAEGADRCQFNFDRAPLKTKEKEKRPTSS